jgi:tetrahydromethanopterin S-methyltransferase subunit H
MFKFDKEQKIAEIAGIKIGGQPGEYPTTLIGTIFYNGHKIVKNQLTGEFDREKAEDLIKKTEELSDLTGNPTVLDVVGSTYDAMTKYVDFVSKVTDVPFLIDVASVPLRIQVLKYVAEVGLQDRAIYNSLDENWREEEITTIRECGLKHTIIMLFSMKKIWPEQRLDLLLGFNKRKGLLHVAEEAGIKNVLVDTAVLDMASIGLSAKTIYLVKETLGLPSGCGPCNATTTWKKGRKQFGRSAYEAIDSATDVLTKVMGADFILYGPIEEAERVFPTFGVIDAIIGYQAKFKGITPKECHPLYKVFTSK